MNKMKLLFENWRKYLNESDAEGKTFTFSRLELQGLNKSIAKIVSAAKKVLGAEGSVPHISLKDLEPAQEETIPLKMVAEVEGEENVFSLRQRYHGPEGELKKRGPRAVRGLEKGLGRMSAEEFEETGYVLKVPEEVLTDFRTLVESTKNVAGLYEEARDWYHNIRELLDNETESDRDSALMGLLIATYSPRAKFSLNLTEAIFMYKAVQQDAATNPELLKRYLETFPGAEKRQPGEFRGFTGAHKVPNFALNLIDPSLAGERDESGNIDYNDLYEWNSTIDTWMIDAFYPSLRKASTAKEWDAIKGKLMSGIVSYRYMATLVAREAKKLNLLPHELQALIWVSSQIRQTGESGSGVTTQFAYDQIRQAIVNVAQISDDLDTLKKLDEKDWLGTILHKIESEGFAKAARIVLEKGKGVRSLAARGKKGTAFKYFPEPETRKEPTKKITTTKKTAVGSKPVKKYTDPEFKELNTYYVMNNVVQMPTGKFNNLYDSVILYLDPEFSTEKAVEYITGRFDPEALSTKTYFKEGSVKEVIKKSGKKWCLRSKKKNPKTGKSKNLGCYSSRKGAEKREKQVQYFKHKGG